MNTTGKGKENLTKNAPRTPEAREANKKNGAKGGRASGAARVRKRKIKIITETIMHLTANLNDDQSAALTALNVLPDGEKEQYRNITVAVAMIMNNAMNGDANALQKILEIVGEDARTRIEREKMKFAAAERDGTVTQAAQEAIREYARLAAPPPEAVAALYAAETGHNAAAAVAEAAHGIPAAAAAHNGRAGPDAG